MRLSIVNPNATRSMTETAAAAARRVVSPGTEILAVTNASGPASIEGHVDGALAVPGLLEAIAQAEREGADAHVIACFDDTGLDAARSIARRPVVGIGEAAAHVASLLSRRFAVVTTLSCSVPILEDNLKRNGLWALCCSVRASEIPVLALEADPEAANSRISEEIGRAIGEDGAEAIVLGCAGMAEFAARLSERHGLPVIEGVSAAAKLAEALAALGLGTSKKGGYAFPPDKPRGLDLSIGPARTF
ncbi:aspartate/glutamate racemase family protein [Aurantimonas sp. VKM B-3413]|uniref:aspartate/glutamate racemase family protein n=1 Tax=Aurantimonas sp. VKM B-3413 TaxID=2779401 RepID=UPI001E635F15|nr:aspartate/glutamate racemase family protein [Aurantimonas sp. VKM B-3413]MCB8838697.1 aspartate/glutamate racemase family protein [Aurantimonas sp. VKM B-3413]